MGAQLTFAHGCVLAADDDEQGLTESLLGEDVADHGEQHPQQGIAPLSPRRSAMIVHPGEFNLQLFVQYLLNWWASLIGKEARAWSNAAPHATSISRPVKPLDRLLLHPA